MDVAVARSITKHLAVVKHFDNLGGGARWWVKGQGVYRVLEIVVDEP